MRKDALPLWLVVMPDGRSFSVRASRRYLAVREVMAKLKLAEFPNGVMVGRLDEPMRGPVIGFDCRDGYGI